jgi:hypothetical protein
MDLCYEDLATTTRGKEKPSHSASLSCSCSLALANLLISHAERRGKESRDFNMSLRGHDWLQNFFRFKQASPMHKAIKAVDRYS